MRMKKGSTNANMSKRKAVKAMVTAECDRTGTDISIENTEQQQRLEFSMHWNGPKRTEKQKWKVMPELHKQLEEQNYSVEQWIAPFEVHFPVLWLLVLSQRKDIPIT